MRLALSRFPAQRFSQLGYHFSPLWSVNHFSSLEVATESTFPSILLVLCSPSTHTIFPSASSSKMPQKLKVAVSGLGRMGARHAINYLEKTPRAELVAACDPDSKALAWAKARLEREAAVEQSVAEQLREHRALEALGKPAQAQELQMTA